MPGFSQRAQVSGGDSVIDALRQYLDDAVAVVTDAVQEEQQALVERQQERASEDDRWSELADQIHSWQDEEGNFAHGVRDDEQTVAQAGLLEYGDERNPPSPLIRMGVLSDVANIRWSLSDAFRRGGF